MHQHLINTHHHRMPVMTLCGIRKVNSHDRDYPRVDRHVEALQKHGDRVPHSASAGETKPPRK